MRTNICLQTRLRCDQDQALRRLGYETKGRRCHLTLSYYLQPRTPRYVRATVSRWPISSLTASFANDLISAAIASALEGVPGSSPAKVRSCSTRNCLCFEASKARIGLLFTRLISALWCSLIACIVRWSRHVFKKGLTVLSKMRRTHNPPTRPDKASPHFQFALFDAGPAS